MAQTSNKLMKDILDLYRDDDPTFPATAMRMIDAYFAGMKPSTSKLDPQRLGSRNVLLSRLRKELLKKVDPLEIDIDGADKYETAKSRFNKMSTQEQLKFQAQAKASGLHKWVHSLDVMPENLRAFQVSEATVAAYQAMRQKADTAKLREDSTEVDADEVMAKLCPALSNPTSSRQALAAALLLVTGRRTAEILKTAELHLRKAGDRTPAQTMDGYECMFTGQTKQGLEDVGSYAIPLLAPYWLVKKALVRLRTLYDTTDMDLDAINAAYSKTLNTFVANTVDMNPHALRAVYAVSTWKLSGEKMSLIGWVSKVLGHSQSTSAVAYQRLKIVKLSGPWKEEAKEVLQDEKIVPGNWVLKGAVEQKRFEGILEMIEQRIPITATSIRAHAGGSMPVSIRIVANNKEVIEKYNLSLK